MKKQPKLAGHYLKTIERGDMMTLGVNEVFGQYIKEKRLAAGLTQQGLGEMLGYTGRSAKTVVQNWEYDKQPVPIEKLRALAKALNIPLESLIP